MDATVAASAEALGVRGTREEIHHADSSHRVHSCRDGGGAVVRRRRHPGGARACNDLVLRDGFFASSSPPTGTETRGMRARLSRTRSRHEGCRLRPRGCRPRSSCRPRPRRRRSRPPAPAQRRRRACRSSRPASPSSARALPASVSARRGSAPRAASRAVASSIALAWFWNLNPRICGTDSRRKRSLDVDANPRVRVSTRGGVEREVQRAIGIEVEVSDERGSIGWRSRLPRGGVAVAERGELGDELGVALGLFSEEVELLLGVHEASVDAHLLLLPPGGAR